MGNGKWKMEDVLLLAGSRQRRGRWKLPAPPAKHGENGILPEAAIFEF
jgi:hypothetical protein